MARTFSRSTAIFEQAQTIIPGGVQASRTPLYAGESPVYIQYGKGSRCWDIDGNEFIDYILGFGPIILGYAHPVVNDAVTKSLTDGVCFTFNHPIQNELARTIIRVVPSAEMVSFCKTGSDATSAAIRIARAYTGRDKVAHYGYHGWHDWSVVGMEGMDTGIPTGLRTYTVTFDADYPETLAALLEAEPSAYAAIIVAPEEIHGNLSACLTEIGQLARSYGAVFILDEVKTGFRLALGGAQERYGVIPDLCTCSKAIANGFPLAVVAGRRAIMEAAKNVWFSSTFNGEILSMAAAIATIGELERDGKLAHIWYMGERLIAGLTDIIKCKQVTATVRGLPEPPMPFLRFTDNDINKREHQKRIFYTTVVQNGILLHPDHVWFISAAHSEAEIDRTLEVCEMAMQAAANCK